jgi:hypothetical protein
MWHASFAFLVSQVEWNFRQGNFLPVVTWASSLRNSNKSHANKHKAPEEAPMLEAGSAQAQPPCLAVWQRVYRAAEPVSPPFLPPLGHLDYSS